MGGSIQKMVFLGGSHSWYEVHDYCDNYEYSKITDKVVAWRKLPKPYESKKEGV